MAKDRYRYFRVEARELVDSLTQGALDLEKGRGDPAVRGRLLRLAHTLKGAARVVKQPAIAELAHAVEGALATERESAQSAPKTLIDELLHLFDAISDKLSELGPGEARADVPASSTPDEALGTARIDLRDMDGLLNAIAEASIQVAALRQATTHVGPGLERSVATSVERLERALTEARHSAYRLRLVPAQTIFASLERAARDAAAALDKAIEFRTDGGGQRMDTHALSALHGALVHMVRNAVAHGIESSPERAAAGKPFAGRIDLHVERRGNRMAFWCRDDGRGIDVEAIRRAAVDRGLLPADALGRLDLEEAVRLILRGGITTTGTVTEVAGRGIGLDVVREIAEQLKGEVRVDSAPGRGTAIEICVPISLSSQLALLVEVRETTASIPLEAVREAIRVSEDGILRTANGESIAYGGTAIPFLRLDTLIGNAQATRRRRAARPAVVIESAGVAVAIGVDRLVGVDTVVARPLPRLAPAEALVAGASLDHAGIPQLLLDADGLVAAARSGVSPAGEAEPARAPTVLVVDDSLTTRMLERSILESAGYIVELATSGEDALQKARARHYDLFVVDVEMPGMDGFEFVSLTRADAAFRDIPAILVTSRNSLEDRRRGEQAGAHAYIAKGEFDQTHLLRVIRDVVGWAR